MDRQPNARNLKEHFRRLELPCPISRIQRMKFSFLLALAFITNAPAFTLLEGGKSDYQIVLPDALPSPTLDDSLVQTARLLQTAFLANKVEVAVVREKERDASKPALMLGNTQLAQKNGLDVTKLRDWSFVHRVVGQDIVIAGHDNP